MLINSRTGFVEAGTTKTIATSKGYILSLIISHAEGTVQTVSLYDYYTSGTNLLLRVNVAPENTPAYLPVNGNARIYFENGLTIVAGNCDVFVVVETV